MKSSNWPIRINTETALPPLPLFSTPHGEGTWSSPARVSDHHQIRGIDPVFQRGCRAFTAFGVSAWRLLSAGREFVRPASASRQGNINDFDGQRMSIATPYR